MPARVHAQLDRNSSLDRRKTGSAQAIAGGDRRLDTLSTIANSSPLQRVSGLEVPGDRSTPNLTGLPDGLKAGVESLSGLSMDSVRVHRNSPRPAQLGALAFAKGTDIHLAPGQERHLPHEAWHVVQQLQRRVPTTGKVGGLALNNDPVLEHEATDRGATALRIGRDAPVQLAAVAPSADAPLQRVEEDTEAQTEQNHPWGNNPEERLERGDLALYEIPDEQWAAIGFGVARDTPDAFRAFAALGIGGIPNSQVFPMFLDWFNHGIFTRSAFRALAARHIAIGQQSGFDDDTPMQMAASANTISGPKSYASFLSGQFDDVSYERDYQGSINFEDVESYTNWSSPVYEDEVDLEDGMAGSGEGLLLSGRKVTLAGASRGNHFSIANRITGRSGNGSPANLTWHHLSEEYKMVLVDRKVHQQHNHNGGNLLWT